MIAVLLKDWRLNAGPFLAVLLLFLALPVLVFGAHATNEGLAQTLLHHGISESLAMGGLAGLLCTFLIIPFFGGIAFAPRRRARSAEFLASMPVPRSTVVGVKVFATLSLCVVPWILCLLLLIPAYLALPVSPVEPVESGVQLFEMLGWLLAIQTFLLGCSWFCSSLLSSPILATSLSILGSLLAAVTYISCRIHAANFGEASPMLDAVTFHGAYIFGIVAFIAGAVIALKRISP